MDETPHHQAAFMYYCTMKQRNLRQLARDFNISVTTAGNWSREFTWQERVKQFDFETAEQLQEIVIKDWVTTKAYLIRVLMKQVIDGVQDGVKPKTTSDMVAAIREIRAMMGDDMYDSVKRDGIMFTRVITNEERTGDKDI